MFLSTFCAIFSFPPIAFVGVLNLIAVISEPSILTLAINEVLLISQYTVSDGLNLLIAATIPHTDQPIRRFAVFTTICIGIYADLLGTEDGGDQ